VARSAADENEHKFQVDLERIMDSCTSTGDGNRQDFYNRIPVWNGAPATLLQHEIDVDWWLEGENLTETSKHNLAA
jgi:hypothetical protein